jgi:hypothetical protein
MAKRSLSSFQKEGKFCCSAFPEPLLKKYGWDSCHNCSIERLQPDQKVDNRRCMRSHGGVSKCLIRINGHCGDDSVNGSNKENSGTSINGSNKENSGTSLSGGMNKKKESSPSCSIITPSTTYSS